MVASMLHPLKNPVSGGACESITVNKIDLSLLTSLTSPPISLYSSRAGLLTVIKIYQACPPKTLALPLPSAWMLFSGCMQVDSPSFRLLPEQHPIRTATLPTVGTPRPSYLALFILLITFITTWHSLFLTCLLSVSFHWSGSSMSQGFYFVPVISPMPRTMSIT